MVEQPEHDKIEVEIAGDLRVQLTRRTADALEDLMMMEGLSKADAVGRAIQVFHFIALRREAGEDIVTRNPKSGQSHRIMWE